MTDPKRPCGRPKGSKQSDETRRKISEARKAALADPAVHKRMSEARKAAWASKGAWTPPPSQARYFAKLLRCGFTRQQARAEIERLMAIPEPACVAA